MAEIDITYALLITAAIGLANILIFLLAYKFLRRSRAYAIAMGLGIAILLFEAIFIRPNNVESLTWITTEFWKRSFFFLWMLGWTVLPVTIYSVINFVVRLFGPNKWFRKKAKEKKGERYNIREIN